MTKETLLTGKPWKGILSFLFPVFIGQLLQQFYNTADTVIVGNFSSEAALALVSSLDTTSLPPLQQTLPGLLPVPPLETVGTGNGRRAAQENLLGAVRC